MLRVLCTAACVALLAGCSGPTPAQEPTPAGPSPAGGIDLAEGGEAGAWILAFWPLAEPVATLDLGWTFDAAWEAPASRAFLWRLGPVPVVAGPDGQWLARPPAGADVQEVRAAGRMDAADARTHHVDDPARLTGILFGFAGTVPWSFRLAADAPGTPAALEPTVLRGLGATAAASDRSPAVAGAHEVEASFAGPGLRHVHLSSTTLQPLALRSYSIAFADGERREALAAAQASVEGPVGYTVGRESWTYMGHFDASGGSVAASVRTVAAEANLQVVLVSLPVAASQLPGAWRPDYEGA